MKRIVLICYFLSIGHSYGLEMDEKLTLRILSISKSKKTLLINRGLEDGLVVGDHAKFFLTTGVIARGVVVKASPTRSIWAMYRLVSEDDLSNDRVMNLKISSKVKVTDDPTKVLYAEARSDSGMDSLPKEGEEMLEVDSAAELDLGKNTNHLANPPTGQIKDFSVNMSSAKNKSIEFWSLVNVSNLSGDYSDQSIDTGAISSQIDLAFGIEKYFPDAKSFISEISFGFFYNRRSNEAGGTIQRLQSWNEFGIDLSYHFYNPVATYSRPVFFVNSSVGIGTATFQTTLYDPALSSDAFNDSDGLEGNSTFFSVGVGMKFLTRWNIGFMGLFDLYGSKTNFEVETTTNSVVETSELSYSLLGPRVRFGLSYRF